MYSSTHAISRPAAARRFPRLHPSPPRPPAAGEGRWIYDGGRRLRRRTKRANPIVTTPAGGRRGTLDPQRRKEAAAALQGRMAAQAPRGIFHAAATRPLRRRRRAVLSPSPPRGTVAATAVVDLRLKFQAIHRCTAAVDLRLKGLVDEMPPRLKLVVNLWSNNCRARKNSPPATYSSLYSARVVSLMGCTIKKPRKAKSKKKVEASSLSNPMVAYGPAKVWQPCVDALEDGRS